MSEIWGEGFVQRLDDRELAARNLMALEGSILVQRARNLGIEIRTLVCVPSRLPWALSLLGTDSRDQITTVPEEEISRVAGFSFHRGVLALAQRPEPNSLSMLEPFRAGDSECKGRKEIRTVLALPEILDPENLGSAFRSAAALGCQALLLGPKGPDPLSRRVLRVSMGASLSLPWARMDGPEELEFLVRSGYELAAAVLDPTAVALDSYRRPCRLALVIGNEAFGLSSPWLERCQTRLTLPMGEGVDSLNLAVAAALFLYALRS
jgi:tRNA G18 (ribose-2'-O)-methylase SpoU